MKDLQKIINNSAAKKKILVVEDELINQEILKMLLQEHYDLNCVSSGQEGLNEIYSKERLYNLILLDLNLPDMHGMDIIAEIKEKGILDKLPVIVLTADNNAEVDSLKAGAMDFIPKPYPRAEIMIARIDRIIELYEGRSLIGQTERDHLTKLYNVEFFYRYVEKMDTANEYLFMDAVIIDINHFHIINERYGRSYGDDVLKRIAANLLSAARDRAGIVCRRNADTFLIYWPHQNGYDYEELLAQASQGVAGEGMEDKVVRVRIGVYPNVDPTLDVEHRFDRAKTAADTVRTGFQMTTVAFYDSKLQEQAIFEEQLIVEFPKALEEKQFVVYFQPKYDVHGDEPVLGSAEALVRWVHPEFGMISPGIFIPLFEENGLIPQLDAYVWREAAFQIKEWRDKLGITIPVSVNVSRIDMYDINLVDKLKALVKEAGLNQGELMLEVTESAYTENSEYIVKTVEDFRKAGFFIEMDDFGTGYSSLNMLSNMPIDALKLDMQFIRSAFKNGKDTRMLEIVIQIAESLAVPIIAEGVETGEQLFTLKSMGCNVIQGYYFSKPVPPDEFETFLLEKKEKGLESTNFIKKDKKILSRDVYTYDAMHDPVTGLYNQSAFEMFLYDSDEAHTALVLAEIDGYGMMRKEYGQKKVNEALKDLALSIKDGFRSTDFVFRVREDVFALIITRVDSSKHDIIFEKVKNAFEDLQYSEEGVPEISLNIVMVFGDSETSDGGILEDAENALKKARAARQSGSISD